MFKHVDEKTKTIMKTVILSTGFIASGTVTLDDIDKNENLIEYSYRYAVDDSKSKGPVMDRWEHRIGEYVKGAYSVVDPDGRVRTVDYEVDGKKGYHAIIRMNEPGPKLLSIQQLKKSIELYPEAALPALPDVPSLNLSPPDPSTDKAWNYHSDTPNINQNGKVSDHRQAAATQVTRNTISLADLSSLPFSPANYNVPPPARLIYFTAPAGSIYQQNFVPKGIKRETLYPLLVENEDETSLRRRRNSRLVRRYKSFSEIES